MAPNSGRLRRGPHGPGPAAALGVAGLWAASGCGQEPCNGQAFSAKPGSPIIERVEVRQPVPDNPWLVTLAVTFRDDGGDLGDGLAFVYFGGSQQVARSYRLRPHFETAEVPLTKDRGTFGLHLRLPPDQAADGTTLQLGLQLEDASAPDPHGLFSNCFRMNLKFAVTPIVGAWRRLVRHAGGAQPS